MDAVSHCCSKRLKPRLILPKEKFEHGEALLSSSSLICIAKYLCKRIFDVQGFFLKQHFHCNKGKEETRNGMFKIGDFRISTRNMLQVGSS